MIERAKSFLLKVLLVLLGILVLVGAVRYFQGSSVVQFLGPEKVYTIEPWALVLMALILLLVLWWVKALLLGIFIRLPAAISGRVKKSFAHRHHKHLSQSVELLVRRDPQHALSHLKKYINDKIDNKDDSFHIWALGVHALLSSRDLSQARLLFDHFAPKTPMSVTDDTTWLLLQARLFAAEQKSEAALGMLVGGLSRSPNDEAIVNEILRVIENRDLDRGARRLLANFADEANTPKRLLNNLAWKRVMAIHKLEDGEATDEWIDSLPKEVGLHHSFVLMRIAHMEVNGKLNACYRLAAKSLQHNWSAEIINRLEELDKPEDETVADVYENLVREYPEHTQLKALTVRIKEFFPPSDGESAEPSSPA